MRLLTMERAELILSNFVVTETYNLLAARTYPAKAREWLLANTWPVERITVADEEEAFRIIKQYADKDYSYTDATSFALMRRLACDMASLPLTTLCPVRTTHPGHPTRSLRRRLALRVRQLPAGRQFGWNTSKEAIGAAAGLLCQLGLVEKHGNGGDGDHPNPGSQRIKLTIIVAAEVGICREM